MYDVVLGKKNLWVSIQSPFFLCQHNKPFDQDSQIVVKKKQQQGWRWDTIFTNFRTDMAFSINIMKLWFSKDVCQKLNEKQQQQKKRRFQWENGKLGSWQIQLQMIIFWE